MLSQCYRIYCYESSSTIICAHVYHLVLLTSLFYIRTARIQALMYRKRAIQETPHEGAPTRRGVILANSLITKPMKGKFAHCVSNFNTACRKLRTTSNCIPLLCTAVFIFAFCTSNFVCEIIFLSKIRI